jgi:hypothetical protein
MQILTFQDASTWDVSPDTGFITFASPEDAKKAEALFHEIQREAKAVLRDAERYRFLADPANYPYDGWWSDKVDTAKDKAEMDAVIDAVMSTAAEEQGGSK